MKKQGRPKGSRNKKNNQIGIDVSEMHKIALNAFFELREQCMLELADLEKRFEQEELELMKKKALKYHWIALITLSILAGVGLYYLISLFI